MLRARIQRDTGLSAHLCRPWYAADSKRPMTHAWEYDGTVHTDVLVPMTDGSAVHVVCGLGVGDHVHVVADEAALFAHLDALGYARGAVIDAPVLTKAALGTKDRLWIVEGPEVGDDSCKLGIDVIRGALFLNGAATARYRGPRVVGHDRVGAPMAWAGDGGWRELVDGGGEDGATRRVPSAQALREIIEAIGRDFRQPDDFADNLMFLARHLDAWCEATLCEPGRSLRAARERAGDTLDEPSQVVVDVLALADTNVWRRTRSRDGSESRATATDGEGRGRSRSRWRPGARSRASARPTCSTRCARCRRGDAARHAMAAELVRLGHALDAVRRATRRGRCATTTRIRRRRSSTRRRRRSGGGRHDRGRCASTR